MCLLFFFITVSKAYVAAPLISAPVVKSYAAPIASYSSYSVAAAPVVSAYAAPAYSAYSGNYYFIIFIFLMHQV